MNIYTIGFSGKSAQDFFSFLVKHKVKKLIDIRLNNKSQLAGFANVKHLPYFLKLHKIEYEYLPQLAPSKELLDGYKNKSISWHEYEKIYRNLLLDRKVLDNITIEEFEDSVLLCSESTAKQCHRRLMAEYIQENFEKIKIKHL